MKKTYQCRMPEYTDDNDWDEVAADDADEAAEFHAEYVFNNRDGWEFMVNNSVPILVKDGDCLVKIDVYTELYPSFFARRKQDLDHFKDFLD